MIDIELRQPPWLTRFLETHPSRVAGEEARMRLVLDLTRANVEHASGGPFGAAVFENDTGRLIAVGTNRVAPSSCSIAHAEMIALAAAQQALGDPDLGSALPGGAVLVASAEPCAMCLGALPWAGITALVCGARDEDVRAIGFDEGDKPVDWALKLWRRGIAVTRDCRRREAVSILQAYRDGGGLIYGPKTGP
jgi:tRNA(Arg) A34 adenosine deaminase TadA